jgi:hypothetical protein
MGNFFLDVVHCLKKEYILGMAVFWVVLAWFDVLVLKVL